MTGRRGRGGGGGGGGNRGGNRGRGGFQAAPSNKATGLDALTGGTVARRGSGRGNHGGAGSRGRGGGFGGGFGAKKENTPEPVAPDDGYTGIPYDPKFALERKGKLNTTPYPWHEYDKRYAYLKNAQRYKKQEQIAAGQLDPDGQMDLSKSVDKHGLCTDMCSELERVRRIVQKDVAGPEYSKETARGPRSDRQPDERRMIAAFHRSSAGDELTLMSDLRTPKALLNSMKVMINRLKEDDFGWLNGWMWDRSRAIRVELNKNYRLREDNEVYVQIYEMCIRFHLLSMHQMANSKAIGKDYSRHTDWEQLGAACNQMKELWDKIKVYMPQDRKTPSPLEASRVAEIHAYNIIVGLKEPDHREEVRTHPRVRTAQAIVRLAQDTKNPAAFWRLVRSNQVSYLLACAAATRFNAVRVDTLEAMVKGFMVHKQKVEELTLLRLVDTLGFDNKDQVTAFCAEFGGEFETDHANVTRLRPETLSIRRDPTIINKQIFSQKYVESKRGGRNLAAVLLGYDMRQAYAEGLVEAVPEEDKDSLFIPEEYTTPNPFTAAAAPGPSSIQPGLFDPSKDAIRFSTPSAATAPTNPFAGVGAKLTTNGLSTTAATPAAGGNPFAQFAAKNTAAAPAANEFGAPTAPAAANAFTFTKPAQNAFTTPATTPAPTAAGTSSLFQTSAGSSTGLTGFSFTNPTNGLGGSTTSAIPSTGLTGFSKLPTFSTPSVTSTNSGTTAAAQLFAAHPPTSASLSTEDGTQKETEEAQRKAREEQERKAQEEQQRVAEEQRKAEEQRRAEEQRKVEEERQRKIQEEQAKARVAEQQRRLREQKEAERLRLESEAARETEEKRKRALEAMGRSLFINPREGFMTQYLQHLTTILAQETMDAMEAEQEARDNARADQMAQQRRAKLARIAFYKWCQVVEHSRRKAQVRRRRERRRQLQADPGELKSSMATSVASPAAPEVQPVGEVREVPEDRPLANITNGSTNETPSKPQQSQLAKKASRAKKEVFTQPNGDFSQSYYEARAPPQPNEIKPIVDRTETNYFKLLAMGVDRETASSLSLDSSKALKRSFGSTEEEDAPQIEGSKRLRRSPSSVLSSPSRFHRSLPPTARPPSALRQSLPPPADDDERTARYRAIKASLARSGHRPSQSIDGSRTFRDSVSRQSTPLAHSTTTLPSDDRPKYWARESRFVPQHLYGKPDAIRAYRAQLGGMSASSSFATSELQVPATKAREQEPDPPGFLLSSPVAEKRVETRDLTRPALGFGLNATPYPVDGGMFPPGQQGLPERIAQADTEEVLVIDDDDDDDADDEDADVDEAEGENELELEGEAEQWDGYGEENGDGEGVYYDEDEEEEEDEILDSDDDVSDEEEYDDENGDDDAAQQKPGATQDDAIELSD